MSAHGFDDVRNDPHLSRARDWLHDPLGDRSGREPIGARSPLWLRLALSIIGVVAFTVLAVLFLLTGGPVWLPVVAIALAAAGVIDAAVITAQLRKPGSDAGR